MQPTHPHERGMIDAVQAVGAAPEELAIELVNGWSPSVRREAGVADDSPPPVDELLARHGVAALGATAAVDITALAESLHHVFAASAGAGRRAMLNDLIEQLDPTPVLTADGMRWRTVPGRELEATAILSLTDHARDDPDLARLGTCAAHRCVDAYVDRSQARVRRYCSVTCLNRAKAMAFRQRKAHCRRRQSAQPELGEPEQKILSGRTTVPDIAQTS